MGRKDKEIESKKGGLDVLFRDGIPLNEHFLALKNRYKKEKKELEDQIAALEKCISDTEVNNTQVQHKINLLRDEYAQFSKRHEDQQQTSQGREREYGDDHA